MKAIPKRNEMDVWFWDGSLEELAEIPEPFDQLVEVQKINMVSGSVVSIAIICGKHSRAMYPRDWLIHYDDAFFTRNVERFTAEFEIV